MLECGGSSGAVGDGTTGKADRATDPAYRDRLLEAEQKMQEAFDKSILSLSGGGLAISMAFLNDIVGQTAAIVLPGLLLGAWSSWAVSITAVLFSFATSRSAFARARLELDRDCLTRERPGGRWDSATACLNAGAGALFLVGLVLIAFFICVNFPIDR